MHLDIVNMSVCVCVCVAGVFWPTESLEKWLKTASRVTPITYPVEAIRDILLKGFCYYL